jgi:signal transduction histidine kinase/CheY-like chemotaxis protein
METIMHWLQTLARGDSASRDMLVSTSRNLVATVATLYTVWHFIATLTWPRTFSPSLWLITFWMILTIGLTLHLLERAYVLSQFVWQIGLAGAIVAAYAIYQRPESLILLILLPLTAIVTLDRWGALLVEGSVILIIVGLSKTSLLPALESGYTLGVILGSIFTGIFGWGVSTNLISALSSASYHYKQARELLEETRRHRGEISKMLKERDHANYQLERLNQMLQFARTKAEEARDDRDRFILAVSHELRSPLNFILGFSDLMVNSPETYAEPQTWPPGLYDDVEQIYRSSTHLMSLINDILDLGQIDAQQMTIYREQAQLPRLIGEAIDMAKAAFSQKGLWLRAEIEPNLPSVFIDSTRIRQVLLNLITNGLRFTERGGVTVRAARQEGLLLVTVEDTGTGIAAEDLPKVFEAFRQVGQDSWRRREGSGLGLAISQRFIQLHGGKMWVESEWGRGSSFFFTLPAIDSTPESLAPIVEERGWVGYIRPLPDKQEPLALFVSSDPLACRIIQQSLDGCKIMPVEDPARVPQIVAEVYPQAIFVDKSRGPDLGFRVRDLPYDLPVIGVFLPGMLEHFESLPGNVRDYLIKPVQRATLVDTVRNLGMGIRHLLVVDDDPAMVRFVTQAFRATQASEAPLPYECLTAYTGQAALEQLKTRPVDAILLDLDLPDISGWEVLAQIQKDETLAQIPVIIISAIDFPQLLYKTGRQVFDVRMRRPLSNQELTALLSMALENIQPVYPRLTGPAAPAPPADRVGEPAS